MLNSIKQVFFPITIIENFQVAHSPPHSVLYLKTNKDDNVHNNEALKKDDRSNEHEHL